MSDDATIETVDEGTETDEKKRIELEVDISDTGPCQKHVKVTVPRKEVERFFDKEFSDLVRSAAVPGFRPGKTPRKLIERRFKKDVAGQVKTALLMQTLEQVGEEKKIEPLSEPDIDMQAIELPEDGDFIYEFDVEVRPEFDLPEYKNLQINQPAKVFNDKDVDKSIEDFRKRFGKTVTKDGGVERGDTIIADVRFLDGKEVLREFEELTIRVDDDLYFRDGHIKKFADSLKGAKAGDSRDLKVTLSDSLQDEKRRGQVVDASFVLREIQQTELPEVNEEFLATVGIGDVGELRDLLKSSLEARLRYRQKEAATEQVMDKIVESANWELPPDLLRRQSERTLQRKIIELQQAGYDEDRIRAQVNLLRQNSKATTAKALKQQFVLQAIAEKEEIKIEEEDLDAEIRALADRTGESVRRVRARVDKEGLWESLAIHALERKTIDKILSYATIKEVPFEEEDSRSSGLDASAVPDEVTPVEPEADSESE